MTNGKIIKTIGIAVTVIGFGVNILTDGERKENG